MARGALVMECAQRGDASAVRALLAEANDHDLDHRDDQGYRALHWAAWFGHTKVVELLLARGCARDATNNDDYPALYYCTEYQYRQGDSAGCEAALRGASAGR